MDIPAIKDDCADIPLIKDSCALLLTMLDAHMLAQHVATMFRPHAQASTYIASDQKFSVKSDRCVILYIFFKLL